MQAAISDPFLRTICKFGFVAIHISQEILVLLGKLDLLGFEARLIKPNVAALGEMLEDGILIFLLESLPAREVAKLAHLMRLVTSSSLQTKFVARGFSFEPRE